MKAWLITWDWMADAAAVADEVAAILSPRYSSERIAGIVEFLYSKRNSTASELAAFAGRAARNPYRPERQFSGGITCGHHPWLHARIVHDLSVSTDVETGNETITWTEPPLYKPREHGFPEMVRDCMPGQCVRRITGPLSDELIWDRIKGQFKPGWEPNRPRPAVQERADSPNPAMETDAKRRRGSSPRR